MIAGNAQKLIEEGAFRQRNARLVQISALGEGCSSHE